MKVHFYSQLSYDVKTSVNAVSKSVDSHQDQMDLLVAVMLHQGCVHDVLPAAKGWGYCAMSWEECCCFVKQSGIVKGQVKGIRELAAKLGKRYIASNSTLWSSGRPTLGSWAPIPPPILSHPSSPLSKFAHSCLCL